MSDHDIKQPAPRRAFSIASTTGDSTPSGRASPVHDTLAPETPTLPPSRTRSILNLTSSTLLGIYSSTGYAPDQGDSTPWGTGAETPLDSPAEDRSRRRRSSVLDTSAVRTRRHELKAKKQKPKPLGQHIARTMVLAATGWGYGVLIGRLHDTRTIAPVPVEGIPHHSYAYLGFWAALAVVLGSALPALSGLWDEEEEQIEGKVKPKRKDKGQAWNDVVRSIGALVGIAFAIRRLPWESTLQLSLTLALSNPAVWYLLDRTATGFMLSLATALTGTALCLVINPGLIPAPSAMTHAAANATLAEVPKVAGLLTHETIGVATWIASVLFVSCICFGNIGRRL